MRRIEDFSDVEQAIKDLDDRVGDIERQIDSKRTRDSISNRVDELEKKIDGGAAVDRGIEADIRNLKQRLKDLERQIE